MSVGEGGLEVETPPQMDAALRALFDYWRTLGAAAGGLPALQDFDAIKVRRLLPNIWIIEVEPESHRFRMRLAGESINAIYRRNIGGRYFAEVFTPGTITAIMDVYRRALAEPAIYFATGNVYAAAGHSFAGERLGLPMLGRDGGTSILLGATLYGGRAEEVGEPRIAGNAAQFHPVRAANHRAVEIIGG